MPLPLSLRIASAKNSTVAPSSAATWALGEPIECGSVGTQPAAQVMRRPERRDLAQSAGNTSSDEQARQERHRDIDELMMAGAACRETSDPTNMPSAQKGRTPTRW
jgi:hypothetical protein